MERSHLCFQPGFPLTVITFRTVFLSLLSPWRQNITMVTYLMLILWLGMISLWWQNVPCLIENLRKHIEPPQAFYPHLECLGLHLDFLRRLAKLAYCIQCSKQINTFNVTLCCVHFCLISLRDHHLIGFISCFLPTLCTCVINDCKCISLHLKLKDKWIC